MNMTCPAAQIIIAIIPIVGIVIGGTVVFFSLLWRHGEKKLQIKAGTYRHERFDLKTCSLFVGLLLVSVGAVLSLFFAVTEGLRTALLGGLLPLCTGIGLLAFYKLNPDFKSPDAA